MAGDTHANALLGRRRAGVLLHPTSLPGPGENGELGAEACRFVDFLVACDASLWQMLPLGPPHEDLSPYQAQSVHAGNPRLIAIDELAHWGWLRAAERSLGRSALLARARQGFERCATQAAREEQERFLAEQAHWLDDYALFRALRGSHREAPWWEWPAPLRDRDPEALADARERLADAIVQERFEQFVFYRQWDALKAYASERGILLFGDAPIFVAHDSAEVWAHREYFRLDEQGHPVVVAGTPPDYFSDTGQCWGNPHYDWERMREDGFHWWKQRMATQLRFFDLVRVDHFRGFEACWEIPREAETAQEGYWVKAPGDELFQALRREFGTLPLVAEDLGYITGEVHALRDRFGLPGMKVLQFAFDGGVNNPYLPHNHLPNCVIYSGTHDNDTTLGWFRALPAEQRAYVCEYLDIEDEDMPWPILRALLASVGRLAVVVMQDILGLGSEHRLNTPGVAEGNWRWRFSWDQLGDDVPGRLQHLIGLYGRAIRESDSDERD